MSYQTDEEKAEAIKKWWRDNGVAVFAGLALGLVIIFGWRYWTEYRNDHAAQASTHFEQMLYSAEDADAATVLAKQSEQLDADFGATPYAALGALVAAKGLYRAGEAEAAIARLERVIEDAPDAALARLAALRLARIQLAEGALDAAESTIATHDDSPEFSADFAAVRGDLAAARGDLDAAREAYETAIEGGAALSQLIQLKLDNLPSAG
ncbi:hypothetical protein MARPU_12920 [Marichromatium purpuratum 984]|uniref:Ancillary SecYEG translocon subunit n=1 Tax=Marichromatium purpuratum 984 TaxID=765910 RepID=W0E197_MARPU|nr:tetratricopeptide repeat protein [Marichromatium purpuratum]AHF04645.1 hypothetical protein MARPU_12920 [Marichromatium purpuratum 984]